MPSVYHCCTRDIDHGVLPIQSDQCDIAEFSNSSNRQFLARLSGGDIEISDAMQQYAVQQVEAGQPEPEQEESPLNRDRCMPTMEDGLACANRETASVTSAISEAPKDMLNTIEVRHIDPLPSFIPSSGESRTSSRARPCRLSTPACSTKR